MSARTPIVLDILLRQAVCALCGLAWAGLCFWLGWMDAALALAIACLCFVVAAVFLLLVELVRGCLAAVAGLIRRASG